MKSNKLISGIIFLTKFHFLQFQKGPKINFWTGKKVKTAKKGNFIIKFFWFIWFHEFFCLDFFKYSGPMWLIRKIYIDYCSKVHICTIHSTLGRNMSTEGISNGPKEVAIDLISGSLGAIASVYVGQPMDTLKVKMQTFPRLYPSVGKCLR